MMGDETRGPLREAHSSRRYDISRLFHSDRREQLLSYGDLDLGWAGPGRSDARGAASDHRTSSSHDFSVRASAFLRSDRGHQSTIGVSPTFQLVVAEWTHSSVS